VHADFSPEALADLDAIYEYIARDKPRIALAWTEKLVDAAEKAATLPFAGRVVPEIGDPKIREVLFRNYRIVYRVEAKRLLVITIIERHRRLLISDEPH
jgi:plasmid stabilization system protein ParE